MVRIFYWHEVSRASVPYLCELPLGRVDCLILPYRHRSNMAAMDLDPMFVKALRLLQSRSKESTDQLKQMLDEVLAQRRAEKASFKVGSDKKFFVK